MNGMRSFIWVALLSLIISFWAPPVRAAIAIDATVSRDAASPSTTVSTLSFSTASANELLLAFVSADSASSSSTTVTNIAGAGLTWVLVQRTNVQLGTSEIWRAFAPSALTAVTVTATLSQGVLSSITVMSFTGVDTSGLNGAGAVGAIGTGNARTGGPTAALVTTRAGSLVLGVGNDWDNAIARTVGIGQVLVHQDLASVGDTYWVQRQGSPTASSGATVTINDTSPTGDRYNLSTVEVLPFIGTGGNTFSASGAITPASNGAGSTIVLAQNGTTVATVTANASGNYTFTGLANGSYTVTPGKTGFTFSPTSQTATVSSANVTVPSFTATATSGSIAGSITPSASGSGATVTLAQNSATIATTTANSSGSYAFASVPNGTYTVIPSKSAFTFTPASQTATVNGAAATVNFTAAAVTISGSITPAASGSGANITLAQNGTTVGTTLADANGNYVFSSVANGTYTVAPAKSGFVFSPATQTVSVVGANATVPAFTASQAPTWTVSGSITPAASGSGATVTLARDGATVGTVTADTSGTYSFPNLANATYLVTPSKAGFVFSPANQSATVNGANVVLPAFAATPTTWSISGAISPSTSGSGTTVTLTQNTSIVATVSANASGNYTFANLANGTYTVTPTKTGYLFSPASQVVTVSGANATGINCVAQFQATSGTISDATGRPTSNHLFYAVNSARWWILYIDSTNLNQLKSLYSSDLVNWTPGASTTIPINHDGHGVSFGAAYYNINSNDVVHVTFGIQNSISDHRAYHARASITGTSINWGSWVQHAIRGTDRSISFIASATTAMDSSNYVFDGNSMWVQFSGVGYLNGMDSQNIDSGSSWTPGFFDSTYNDIETEPTEIESQMIVPLATRNMLTVVDNNPAPRTLTNFRWSQDRDPNSWFKPASNVLAQNIATQDVDDWTLIKLSNTDVRLIYRTGSNTYAWQKYDGTSWTAPPASIPNQSSKPGAGVFAATDGTHIWMFVIDTDASNTIRYLAFDSTNWGTWTAVPGTGSGTNVRGFLSGSQTVVNNTVGLIWSQTDGANYGIASLALNIPIFPRSWSISGTTAPASSGAGSSITLSGTSSGSVSADASGNYTFSNLANGTYTVTPGKTGFSFTPASQSVTVNGANVTGINFTAQASAPPPASITIDANVSGDQAPASATVTTPAFSTTSGSELLLAFIAGDYQPSQSTTNLSVSSVSGGGLTWVLVKRTNAQAGSAEIWRAFAPSVLTNATVTATLSQSVQSSITVLSFAGVDTTGTNGSGAIGAIGSANASSGAPTATLVTTRNNSWVFGVGNDYDRAIARTPGSGQKLVHQDLAPINDTYWVQMQNAATPLSGSSVTINDTAPTTDRYNLSIVEVLPAPGSGGGVPTTFSISGTISPGANGSGATVSLSGTASATATADGNGNYVFTGLNNGSYAITPAKNGFSFTPPAQNVAVSGANATSANFTAQPVAPSGIRLVQARATGNESGTANMSLAFNTNNTTGNFLIVTGTAARPARNISVSDTLGNTYSLALGPVTDIAQDVTLYIWYVPACKGGTNTVTIVPAGTSALEIHVSEWSGLANTNPVDVTAFATGTGVAVSSGAKTTTSSGDLVFGYGWVFNTASPGTGFTPLSLINGDLDEYQIQSVAGSVAATFTQTSGTWAAAMVAFKSQASVTGPRVSMTSPAPNATVTANSTVSATASDPSSSITGVQFLLDGNNLGARVTSPPYSITWNTTTATAGTHSLSATVFDSAGLSANAAPISVTADNSGNATIVGNWSAPVTLPTVAVNLLLLKNNSLLFYQDGATATVWDYVNNKFTTVPTSTNLFCSGHAVMADGRVLLVGGYGQSSSTIGIANAEIFDPSTNSWTAVPPMGFRRWYPTATTLSDGRILVTAGWQTTNHTNAGIPEIYDPVSNQWTQLTNANNPFETYPFMFQLSDGRIIHTGGTEFATNTDALDISAQTWTVLDSQIVDGGSATMYSPGKILKSGSAADSQSLGPSSNTSFTLDTTQPSATWQQVPSMAYPRSFLNLTTLPDGTVLATGGETDRNGGNIANAVYAAELWSPQTQTWTTMAAMHTPREYHSTALLLPDGRVLQSGMGADFGNVPDEMTAEFYSPPYLFKGARPIISQAPAQIHFATNFFVATPDAATITSVVLIRTGAVTHFFDQNTRFVPITFQQAAGGLTLTAPANGFAAPPGHYMLFLVNGSGVPSVAPIIQLTQ